MKDQEKMKDSSGMLVIAQSEEETIPLVMQLKKLSIKLVDVEVSTSDLCRDRPSLLAATLIIINAI